MKWLKKGLLWLGRSAVLLGCGVISVFVVMSGYESVYNRSLPLVHTVDAINLDAIAPTYNLADALPKPSAYGNFGKPTTLKLPAGAARLDIVAPIYQPSNNTWLARSNTMHLLLPSQPRAGNIGVLLLYCRSSFRTIGPNNLPKIGDNIFVDTDQSWRYVYKVVTVKQAPQTNPYITQDDQSQAELLINCNDAATKLTTDIEATLLTVQGVEQ